MEINKKICIVLCIFSIILISGCTENENNTNENLNEATLTIWESSSGEINYNIVFNGTITVYDLLIKCKNENNNFDFNATYYDSYDSYFITSINGYESNNEYYWMYYVNGEMAMTGVNHQNVIDKDIIEFKYEN